jgi:ketosteroid isomerase-like protein
MMKAREAIAEGYKAFELGFFRGDADTISQMYTEDAELLIPDAPIVSRREAIAQVWRSIVGSGGSSVRVNTGEVQESGDWAYEVGAFATSAPDGKFLNAGKYIVIWKRQSVGEEDSPRHIQRGHPSFPNLALS